MKKQFTAIVFGIIIGAAASSYYIHTTHDPASLAYPPKGFEIYEKQGFLLQYDSRNKIPLWTYEILTKDKLTRVAHREKCRFLPDDNVPLPHRSSLHDYKHSGFDRGHFIPAADCTYSKASLKDSFLLSNVCPQEPSINRGIWSKLEKRVRELVKTHGEVEVISGPVYRPIKQERQSYFKFRSVGSGNVAVPTHLFKYVYIPAEKIEFAYLVPNSQEDTKLEINDLFIEISELESLSGLILNAKGRDRA